MAELNIIEEKENALFKRKEIFADLTDEIVPKAIDVAQMLSNKYSVPLENIALKKIVGKFGSKTFEITANVYESKDDLKTTEPKHNHPAPPKEEAKEEPKEAAPVETPAEPVEKKKEEPAEKPKEEEKPVEETKE